MEDQELVLADSSSFIDERTVRRVRLVENVSVFLNIGGSWGYVGPGSLAGLNVDFASVDVKIPRALARLRDEFGIAQVTVLQPPVRSYVHFVSKAKRYSNEELLDEAFVHYVIALELLFGERARTNESVSRRVATLVFRPFSVSIVEAERMVTRLYDARSRYVHSGHSIDPSLIKQVDDVCAEVLWALLRRLKQHGSTDDAVGIWTKELDYIYSAIAAGKELAEDDLVASGISPTRSASASSWLSKTRPESRGW
jgi:hypothetical protein